MSLPDMPEAELKKLILKAARDYGWIVYHVPNRPLTNSGVGYPDLTLARDGEVQWMELKTQYGALSTSQDYWIRCLPRASVIRPSDWYNGRVNELLS